MKKKSKIIIVAAVLAVVAAAAAVTVYAYLQNTAQAANVFSVGEDKVEVNETFNEPYVMNMHDVVQKTVAVDNTGSSNQFVRVYLDFSDSRIRDNALILYAANNTSKECSWSEFLADLPDGWAYIDKSDTDGELLGGYFYYTKVLPAGESTPALIHGLKTDFRDPQNEDDDNTDKITDFDIIVYSESVQTTEIAPDDPSLDGKVYADSEWKKAWKSFLSTP